MLLSCIPCEGRIGEIVDVPNAVATLAIPLAIFDRDVRLPSDMSKLAMLARGISILEKNVCLSVEGGAKPYDPRLARTTKKKRKKEDFFDSERRSLLGGPTNMAD